MKQQKIFALISAIVLIFSMSISAIAEDTLPSTTGTAGETPVSTPGITEITVGTILNLPTIDVKIQAPPQVIVNPYHMQYNMGGTKTDSLISAAAGIENYSTIGVTIQGTPKAEPQGLADINFLSAKSTATSFDKATLFMTLNLAPVDSAVAPNSTSITPSTGKTIQTAIVTTDGSKSATFELAAAADADNPKYGAYLLSGEAYGDQWKSTDLFTVTLAFDIRPKVGAGT